MQQINTKITQLPNMLIFELWEESESIWEKSTCAQEEDTIYEKYSGY